MVTVSVVTINRNNEAGLRKTMDSVLIQTYSLIEYIVIDGGSTDGSLDIILSHQSDLGYWISEPDTGLYNAMNKGLTRATGDYILFLNSGDCFYNKEVIKDLVNCSANEDIIYGNLCVLTEKGIQIFESANLVEFNKRYQHNLPPQPALLARTSVLREIGGFDERYSIVADVVAISKMFRDEHRTYRHVNMPVTIFDTRGISSHTKNQRKIYEERKTFIKEEVPLYLCDFEKIYCKEGFFKRVIKRIKKVFSNFTLELC